MMKLKRCPFCGAEGNNLDVSIAQRTDRPLCQFTGRIVCLECFAEMHTHGFHWTYQEAQDAVIEAWNRRINDSS